MSIKHHLTFITLLGLAACDTAPTTVEPVKFTQVSAANLPFFEKLGDRSGWGYVGRTERAEGNAMHRLIRIAPEGVEEQRTKMTRDCVLSRGGKVLAAERTTFADGDAGLLVTCSQ